MNNQIIKDLCVTYNIQKYSINPDFSINVDQNVNISNRGLTEIPLNFNKVSGYFSCSDNQITSLEGCPDTVLGSFYCNHNLLTDLEFSPRIISNDFMCGDNQLTTLKGAPDVINGTFYCGSNPLKDIEYLPRFIRHRVHIIGVEKELYYKTMMYLLENDNYPFYTTEEVLIHEIGSDPKEHDDFMSWLAIQKRINTISDIINSDD